MGAKRLARQTSCVSSFVYMSFCAIQTHTFAFMPITDFSAGHADGAKFCPAPFKFLSTLNLSEKSIER
jgi:hypothetical protein